MLSFYVAVAVVVGLSARADEIQKPDWGFQSYLDEKFTLPCNHSTLMPTDSYVVWELPNGTKLEKGSGKYELSNSDTVANMYLKIDSVTDGDAGVYVCHVFESYKKTMKRGQLLRGLNLGGPKYREPFDEYRDHLMVAGIAALVFLVPMLTLCFVYKFRYQTQEERAAKHAARLENSRHQRYLEANGRGDATAELSEVNSGKGETNPAYDNAEDTRL